MPADSEDYEKANKELTEWKKELDEAVKKYQEVLKQQQEAVKSEETEPALTTPQPLPTIEEEDQVVVPTGTDLAPPIE
ncbi:MAG: hypothetical protein BWY29_00993 [Microgenomates group bacterium ADurb.Bin238]|nr:MAG: hypothetical protein BWY29_00993 [Microgenomates group bacterium ADurb.Bin238]